MYSDINAFILAGGKSLRMGVNKSLLKLGGITVIERAVNLLEELFPSIALITNSPEEYAFLGLEMYNDIYPGAGPLAGVHSALLHSSSKKNFIISCDIPLMSKDVIAYLINYPTTRPITIAKADNFIQQLCGLYDKSVLPLSEEILKTAVEAEQRHPDQKRRGCRVLELVNAAGAEIIDIEKEYPFYIPGTFFNMNKPAEYEEIIKKLHIHD
jgi:molybdopterin-guanine dinucleotide biosynthesis protein A